MTTMNATAIRLVDFGWPRLPEAKVELPASSGLAVTRSWFARAKFRAELRRLDLTGGHLLADLGLDAAWVRKETAKRFWQA